MHPRPPHGTVAGLFPGPEPKLLPRGKGDQAQHAEGPHSDCLVPQRPVVWLGDACVLERVPAVPEQHGQRVVTRAELVRYVVGFVRHTASKLHKGAQCVVRVAQSCPIEPRAVVPQAGNETAGVRHGSASWDRDGGTELVACVAVVWQREPVRPQPPLLARVIVEQCRGKHAGGGERCSPVLVCPHHRQVVLRVARQIGTAPHAKRLVGCDHTGIPHDHFGPPDRCVAYYDSVGCLACGTLRMRQRPRKPWPLHPNTGNRARGVLYAQVQGSRHANARYWDCGGPARAGHASTTHVHQR